MEHQIMRVKDWIQPFQAYGFLILKAYLCAFAFTHGILRPVYVTGDSMVPQIQEGALGFSNIALRHMEGIQRFDIVLIQHNEEIWVKRVIGLPKETVEVYDHQLYINDMAITEPFATSGITKDFGPIEVSDHCVFVMGDNRQDSYDSRNIGCIPVSSILSKDLYALHF